LRPVPGPALWSLQRRDRLGPRLGRGVPHPPLPPPGVLPAGRRQVGPTPRPARRQDLFRPVAGLDPPGLAVHPLGLALDATNLGDCFTVLSIGLVSRGQAIPVAWKVLHANVPHPWKPEWIVLLRLFARLVPPGHTVIVMTDRALYARW